MRQIWISKAGPPETLLLKEAPDPSPGRARRAFALRQAGSISLT